MLLTRNLAVKKQKDMLIGGGSWLKEVSFFLLFFPPNIIMLIADRHLQAKYRTLTWWQWLKRNAMVLDICYISPRLQGESWSGDSEAYALVSEHVR